MISDKDRSGYFGASDVGYICGNWETKSFSKWWLEKVGCHRNTFTNEAMQAGTNFEHKILDSLGLELEKDKQIIIEDLRLRVNLDGNSNVRIYEVKTHDNSKEFKISKQYYRQTQIQMFADNKKEASLVAYGLEEKDYKNFFNKIDKTRLKIFEIEYDADFIEKEFLPKLKILSQCLKNGEFPKKRE